MTDIVQKLRDLQSSQEVFSCDWSFLLEAAAEIERNRATIAALEASLRAAEEREKGFVDALIWCSGSADFNEGGQAREGWLKLCRPLIDAALAGAKPC